MTEPVQESVVGQPHAALSGLVNRYVGYRLSGFEPGIHYALPSGALTFIITIDEPLRMPEVPDPGQGAVEHDLLVAGLHHRRGLILHDGHQHGIQVELHALAARQLFGMPSGELANQVVDVADLLGPVARELHARVSECEEWAERFAVVDEVLLRRLRTDATEIRPELVWSWTQISRSGGRIAVADLADEIGWSRRHLTAQFSLELGLTPKTAARVVRFDRARRMLTGPGRRLADVAAACGYADQSHLSREFRAIVDRAPTELFREDPTLAAAVTGGASPA